MLKRREFERFLKNHQSRRSSKHFCPFAIKSKYKTMKILPFVCLQKESHTHRNLKIIEKRNLLDLQNN